MNQHKQAKWRYARTFLSSSVAKASPEIDAAHNPLYDSLDPKKVSQPAVKVVFMINDMFHACIAAIYKHYVM
jgi:hypothetical protein